MFLTLIQAQKKNGCLFAVTQLSIFFLLSAVNERLQMLTLLPNFRSIKGSVFIMDFLCQTLSDDISADHLWIVTLLL